MESVAAASHPDDSRSPRRWRKVKRRAGHAHIAFSLLPLLIPHVWVGAGVVAMVLRGLVFPLVWKDVDARLTSPVDTTGGVCTAHVVYDVDGARGVDTIAVDCGAYGGARVGDPIPVHAANIAGTALQMPRDETRVGAWLRVLPMFLFAAFWNAIVLTVVWTLSIRPLLRYWLVRRGVRTTGVLDELKVTRGKGASVTASFHFDVTHAGFPTTIEAKSRAQGAPATWASSSPSPALTPGSRVTVYYHPRFPRIATIDALCSYDVVDDGT